MSRVSITGFILSILFTFGTIILLTSNNLLPLPDALSSINSEFNNMTSSIEQARQTAEVDNPSVFAQAYFYVSNVFAAFKMILQIPLAFARVLTSLLSYAGIPSIIITMISTGIVFIIVIALIRRRLD